MKILLIDNYDSFTFNMVNILRKFRHSSFEIRQPHEIRYPEISKFDKIIFSPGPGIPEKGDHMWEIIHRFHAGKSMLGICLGFHAIAMYFGVRLRNLGEVVHGQTRTIEITDPEENLFNGINSPFQAGLYHSWTHDEVTYPDELKVTARSNQGVIMALAHSKFDLKGFQFHPESVMTPEGFRMIHNWLSR